MDETIEERLAALERAVTDGSHDCSALAEGAAAADRVTEIESELDDLTDRVAELEAATQALRGYVGNVRSVNTEVEERADLALSKAEAARRAVDQVQSRRDTAVSGADGTGDTSGVETDGSAADDDREGNPSAGRCAHCDQPLGNTDDQSRESGDGSGPTFGSRVEALGGDDIGRTDPPQAVTGAQTDGGVATDERADDGTGILARVRALL